MRTFISFLGTNNYINTFYECDGQQSDKPVRFIQEALIRMHYWGWTKNDKVIIFCTKESFNKNWLDNGHERIVDDLDKIGLSTILSQMKDEGFQAQIIVKNISNGFSEKEIWEIFEEVYSQIDENSNIYFDMTHAFRSIPFFAFTLFNYSKFMKSTVLKAVHYGAFEKLGSAKDVLSMDVSQRIAPIIDLKNILELQYITEATSNYMNFGKFNDITNVLKSNSQSSIIINISKLLNELELNILTCRSRLIDDGNKFRAMKSLLNKVIKSDIPNPIKEVLRRIYDEVLEFKDIKDLSNLRVIVDWALNYDMIQQAYTIGQELIITYCCDLLKEYNPYRNNKKNTSKEFRQFVSAILGMKQNDFDKREFEKELKEYPNERDKIISIEWVLIIRKYYIELSKYRNIINHAKGTESPQLIISEFKDNFNKCLEVIDNNIIDNVNKPI